MNDLSPIPVPTSVRWREFRMRILPAAVLLGTIAASVWLWQMASPSASFPGQVDADVMTISCPKAGVLVHLAVNQLQPVRQGDVLARIQTTDPSVVQASLAVIEAEIHSLRANLAPILPRERLAVNYDRLRLACLEQRVELASTQAKLRLAESELRRAEELFEQKILSRQGLEEKQGAHERLTAEVQERAEMLNRQEDDLRTRELNHAAAALTNSSGSYNALDAAIQVQEAKLRLTEAETSPVTLLATMDGIVTTVYHRVGETVHSGQPVLTITATNAARIVGYLRRPFPATPVTGGEVEVRPRWSVNRARARVLKVGTGLEQVRACLRLPGGHDAADMGLPVYLSMPDELKLLPGEVVDLAPVTASRR